MTTYCCCCGGRKPTANASATKSAPPGIASVIVGEAKVGARADPTACSFPTSSLPTFTGCAGGGACPEAAVIGGVIGIGGGIDGGIDGNVIWPAP